MNGFYVAYFGGSPTSATLDALAAQVSTIWNSAIAPLVTPATQLTGVSLTDLASSSGAEGTDSPNHAGTDATALDGPVNLAMVISWPVNLRWRGGHFRTYMAGVGVNHITGGNHWGTFASQASTAWATFRTGIAGMTGANSPYSLVGVRYRGKDTTISYPAVVNLNAPAVHPRVDTQRRRLGSEVAA